MNQDLTPEERTILTQPRPNHHNPPNSSHLEWVLLGIVTLIIIVILFKW